MVNNKANESSTTPEATWRALLRAIGLIRRAMEPYFASFGISGAQWGVLIILQRAKKEGNSGLWLKDIGERLLIQPPSVSAVVGRLQRMGLVARETSSTDSRARQISLTRSGSELVERILKGHRAKINTILGGLTPGEQTQLHDLLARVGSHLGKMEQYDEESTVY